MGCCEHGDERSGVIRPQAFLAQLNGESFTNSAPVAMRQYHLPLEPQCETRT